MGIIECEVCKLLITLSQDKDEYKCIDNSRNERKWQREKFSQCSIVLSTEFFKQVTNILPLSNNKPQAKYNDKEILIIAWMA